MSNTWIELDLGILRNNLRNLQSAIKSSTEIIFVVKSNAYGHGIVPVSQCAWECGVKWFAVTNINEALILREIMPDAGIIIVGVMDQSAVAQAIGNNIVPFIISEKHATDLASTAAALKAILRCHAKVDTGMGRLGFPWEEAPVILPKLARLPGLDICGFCTHFASANNQDRSFASTQAERFNTVIRLCEEKGLSVPFKHISNSGAVLCDRAWHMDGIRPGILLYGYGKQYSEAKSQKSESGDCVGIQTKPFLQWKTRIIQVKRVPAGFPISYDSTYITPKETRIAVIDVGYADGYSRKLSNIGFVIAGGRRCHIVGRITMNLTMIDLGMDTKIEEGDEVVLIGSQGSASIWADEIAHWCGTIPYEILTSIRTTMSPRIV